MNEARLQKLSIDTIRTLAMDGVQQAGAGHPGTAMALAPLAYTLYRNVMRHNPVDPEWEGRDRFVLSAGHACILQYACLHLCGYNLSLEELRRFRQWGSRTPGHPEHFLTEGIETTTGPLGQGFANGVGFAIADRFLAERYNRPHHELVGRRVYAICSDGDMMEGVTMEAASIAGHLGLGQLVYFYDDNHITIDGTTSLSYTTEDKGKRFEAHGWHVQSVDDSEDVPALEKAIAAAQRETERPSLVIVRSHIAFGAPKAIDTAKSHGAPLGADEVAAAKKALGWDPEAQFLVPPEVMEHMAGFIRERGIAAQEEWKRTFERWSTAFPGLREEWDADRTGKPRPGWLEALPVFPAGEDVATRDAGKAVMQAFKLFTPTMIGGAADLVESTKTEFEGAGLFSASHTGRNIPFGIREHAMGSIVNGISLTQGMLKPYGSTFLIFSDYMRPAVRLSALGYLQSVWAWTHDSVAVG
ncbi:MAG: transketolase, partial [Actinomycetota bacterium]|nr:transketolase [Actinomycetota bacterium]